MSIIVALLAIVLLAVGGVLAWRYRRLVQGQPPPAAGIHKPAGHAPPDQTPPHAHLQPRQQPVNIPHLPNAPLPIADPTYDLIVDTGQLRYNDAFFAAFGYQKTEPGITTLDWWVTHIHPGDAMRLNATMDKLFDGSITNWDVSYRFQKADSSYVTVDDHALIRRNEGGAPIRLMGTLTLKPAASAPAA